MPSNTRNRPQKLAAKLAKIRSDLQLSQSQMVKELGADDQIDRAKISEYETGRRLPPLNILLAYARAGGLIVDDLIDDEIDI